LFSQVAEIVIKRGIAIRLAYDMVTEPQKEEVQIARKLSDEETIPRKRVLRLYENLGQEKETVARLVKQNEALESELARQKSLIGYLKKKMSRLASDEKREDSIRRRQEQINGLRSQMQAIVSEIAELKQENALQRSMLSEAAEKIFAKKLRNLGMQEFEKKSQFLNIRERDILLVDDPNIISEAVIQKINQMENLLIVKKKMSEKTMEKLDTNVVDANSVRMQESSYFAAVDKKTVERIRSDPSFLKKLVRDYQASRK
jgi:predicted RNase H-like nuclease (RuvC/YqgF family)